MSMVDSENGPKRRRLLESSQKKNPQNSAPNTPSRVSTHIPENTGSELTTGKSPNAQVRDGSLEVVVQPFDLLFRVQTILDEKLPGAWRELQNKLYKKKSNLTRHFGKMSDSVVDAVRDTIKANPHLDHVKRAMKALEADPGGLLRPETVKSLEHAIESVPELVPSRLCTAYGIWKKADADRWKILDVTTASELAHTIAVGDAAQEVLDRKELKVKLEELEAAADFGSCDNNFLSCCSSYSVLEASKSCSFNSKNDHLSKGGKSLSLNSLNSIDSSTPTYHVKSWERWHRLVAPQYSNFHKPFYLPNDPSAMKEALWVEATKRFADDLKSKVGEWEKVLAELHLKEAEEFLNVHGLMDLFGPSK